MSRKIQKMRFLVDESTTIDTLHKKAVSDTPCSGHTCHGSLMMTVPAQQRKLNELRPKEELLEQAKDFIEQYYTSIKRLNTPAHQKRWQEVHDTIERTGTYDLATAELIFGAKTAWRNAPRCIGRITWSKLQVFDARHIATASGMFDAICNHIKYATNKGNLRSTITVFAHRKEGGREFRVWNGQLIRYAAYRQPDGSIVGDPVNLEFTEICQQMGWKGNGGRFDILPLILQANGQDPELFKIPPEIILEVHFKHPEYPWFEELGLRWYALPAVSCLMLDCGGLEFSGIPFNGWYMGTEIGARDLCDSFRYNVSETVAKKMGLNTGNMSTLWKDRALVEVNVAVLYSFQMARVTIMDHHAASESFMKHMNNEMRLRGGCPADWVWVVPPMSGSILPVFHQEMLRYVLKPSYEYQIDPWKTYVWKKDQVRQKAQDGKVDSIRRRIGFRQIARAVKFTAKLMGKALARRVNCTIMYATETGKSETFARRLGEIFNHAFHAKVLAMQDYDISELEHENLVLLVSSTFGNGDSPENGEEFTKGLSDMLEHERSSADPQENGPAHVVPEAEMNGFDQTVNLTEPAQIMANVRYSVFGLGSSAYPNFCQFAKCLDNQMEQLGGECIFARGEGDELHGQEQSFQAWAHSVFRAACETFCVGDAASISEATGSILKTDHSWSPGKFRFIHLDNDKMEDICEGLSKIHRRSVYPCSMISRENLQSSNSPRSTIIVKMDAQNHSLDLAFSPGDHVAIYPANPKAVVDAILSRLTSAPPPDQLIQMEISEETNKIVGSETEWVPDERLPHTTIRGALSRYLDITTPPTPVFLKQLVTLASDESDHHRLEKLASDPEVYEEWRHRKYPNIAEVLEEFPSVCLSATLLLSQLPVLQPRFYSISASPLAHPGEIHTTVAVVSYVTEDGKGKLHHGVCSSWLNNIHEGEMVPCYVRHANLFHMPTDLHKPIIMVGPGTGIAPFRSFWHNRKVDSILKPEQQPFGRMTLYSGCRQALLDDLYREEKKLMQSEGILSDVYTALSREPGQPKVYVQDILMKNGHDIYRTLMEEDGHFYVCGDVTMAQNVCWKLEVILQKHGSMSQPEAKKVIKSLKNSNRFHEDIFGVTLRTFESNKKQRVEARKGWRDSALRRTFDKTTEAEAEMNQVIA